MPSQAAVSKAITTAEMAWNCRRKTRGISVTTSKFMSSCIFEWDSGDLELLRQTKNIELMQKTGVRMPSQADVSNAEMARNCRRKTRGICVRTSKDWSWSIFQLRDGCLWSCHLERGNF
ncbi:unnamed protein product [Clavelina lepadiformis]|uniref:Uncharacterized protein n=1 Tax=Clavelina lepadiformis TaxID=159417 RepID=A0ABP0G6F5_CLALP